MGQPLLQWPTGVQETAHKAGVYKSGVCQVTYRLSNWGSGFSADVTILNTGTTAFMAGSSGFSSPRMLRRSTSRGTPR